MDPFADALAQLQLNVQRQGLVTEGTSNELVGLVQSEDAEVLSSEC